MIQQNQDQAVTEKNGCPPVPESILQANRVEFTDAELKVTEVNGKKFPEDLRGHVFIIAPVGTVDSGGLPFVSGDSFLCGDGMVYRISFNENGKVLLNTKIVKPPDYYADQATYTEPQYAKYKFRNQGIMRFSLCLGFRNDLSIAFLPMKFENDDRERLLVTYDAGRHYEIDPQTLEVVTPVGWNKEWRGEIDINLPVLKIFNFPFAPVLSTAHPVFDVRKSQMFTVDYGRSLCSFIQLLAKPALAVFRPLQKPASRLLEKAGKSWSEKVYQCLSNFRITKSFVYLVRWDGEGQLERWRLVLPNGSPVKIKQSIHQIGMSEDYIIIVDTSYTTGIEQAINDPCPKYPKIEEYLRETQDVKPNPITPVYIVPRSSLNKGQRLAMGEEETSVKVIPLNLPLEVTHFLVDYDNPDRKITLHAAHTCAWDVSEWIRSYDVSAYPPYNSMPPYLLGMEQSEMDISRVGRYVIDGETGEILEQKVIPEQFDPAAEDSRCTWGVALYAYLDRLPSNVYPTLPPGKLDNIYWVSLGLWKDLITEFMVKFTKDYPAREVPLEQLCKIAETEGRPSCLFRMDTSSTEAMKVADCYEFPPGYIGLSPQFVARGDGNSSTDGYIVCTVWYDNTHEIWIFEAWNLKQGPQWKLSHEALKFGVTLHTAWLPETPRRQASYYVPVEEDYHKLVECKPNIKALFEREVYPHFKKHLSSPESGD